MSDNTTPPAQVWPSLRANEARALTRFLVDDADALCERIRAGGGEIITDLHDTDYGSRDFAIRDPEGKLWSFGTYRGEPRKG